jgi:uncharacterized protein
MRTNVAQLLKKPAGTVRWHDLSEDIRGIDDELKIEDLLTGPLKMIRTTNGILVTGALRTVLELECSRCLEPVSMPIELEIEEEFRPSVDINTGATLPMTDDDEEATIIDKQHILDLTEVVRQAVFLALPMHPLCQENCAGLCVRCGQNLNEGQCDCIAEAADPRMEILKQLL